MQRSNLSFVHIVIMAIAVALAWAALSVGVKRPVSVGASILMQTSLIADGSTPKDIPEHIRKTVLSTIARSPSRMFQDDNIRSLRHERLIARRLSMRRFHPAP